MSSIAILANGRSLLDFRAADWQGMIIGLNRSWELAPAGCQIAISKQQLERMIAADVRLNQLIVAAARHDESKWSLAIKVKAKSRSEVIGVSRSDIEHGGQPLGFCTDWRTGELWVPSVTYLALQVAYAYAQVATEIHIWGLDLKGGKFYDEGWTITPAEAEIQNRHLRYAAGVLKGRGVRVVNRSKDTACDAFEVM